MRIEPVVALFLFAVLAAAAARAEQPLDVLQRCYASYCESNDRLAWGSSTVCRSADRSGFVGPRAEPLRRVDAPPRSVRYTAIVIHITVNGEARDLPAGTTLRQLVETFKLKPEKVAIEWNRRLARAEKYELPLNDGDVVEIVTFVGGG